MQPGANLLVVILFIAFVWDVANAVPINSDENSSEFQVEGIQSPWKRFYAWNKQIQDEKEKENVKRIFGWAAVRKIFQAEKEKFNPLAAKRFYNWDN